MKRLITCLVALFLVTVMAWSQGTKKINSIKRSNQYLYAEATMPTQAEAFEVANDLLLIQVKEYAGSKKAFDDKDILIINNDGIVIRLWAKEIPVLSRVTQGVTLMRSKNATIVDVAIVDHEEEEETESIPEDAEVLVESGTEELLERAEAQAAEEENEAAETDK